MGAYYMLFAFNCIRGRLAACSLPLAACGLQPISPGNQYLKTLAKYHDTPFFGINCVTMPASLGMKL